MNDLLVASESQRRDELEATITRGMASFVEVGLALTEIRNSRLYRSTHESFDKYCKDKWEMGKAYCNRLADAAGVTQTLAPIGVIPRNEAQIRPLTVLDDPEQQRQAWSMATAQAEKEGRAVIAKDVKRAVENVICGLVEEEEEDEEEVEEPEQPEKRVHLTFSYGLQYAQMAINQLKSINKKDTQRQEAFNKVITWIKENR